MIIYILFVLGLCFGSFANALVWRIYQQHLPSKKRLASIKDLSITKGRSMCPHCQHVLAWYDLLPVVSWLALHGKCRYCHKPISPQYPLVELATAGLFVASYIYWPLDLSSLFSYLSLAVWLASSVGLTALFIYDLRWMLLPNRIVFPLIGLSAVGALLQAAASDSFTHGIFSAIGGLAVAGGLFYILFQLSGGRWIGGGDVKLGFALGLLLGSPVLAFLMLFAASVLGLLVSLPAVLLRRSKLSAKIPFGPFLIIATVMAKLFGQPVIDWYSATFLYF